VGQSGFLWIIKIQGVQVVFRGFSTLNLDAKGRLAIPSRYRERLAVQCESDMVLTLNPLDRCLWLYPLPEWELIETKLSALSDFDKQSRRAKQMMRGYASDCELDGHGRILVSQEHREYAGISKRCVILGQGNKFELWDQENWESQRDAWLGQLDEDSGEASEALRSLSL